ncbi:hypothetical protein [Amaricoccus sp.]|uniref:hypothetical protein n=1 Tax=Amaricoccus sp. TaxID=1872485 RepID=UPI0026257B39|nr:hypothetical protein [Amaricoccus sp.]HRO10159.1 hypothetical protein [Amaricoccus sp.]
MTEETESLVLEILKRLQSEFALMREDMRGMRAEMTALKQHMDGRLHDHELTQDSDVASIKLRLDRIERRLDLTD